jgi:hypothetical protein
MNRILLAVQLGAACFCLLLVAACGGDEDTTTPATPASPQATTPSGDNTPIPATASGISARGEEIERLANNVEQQVTWEDGTKHKRTIPDLVFDTASKPDAGQGHRVVARWLGDTSWQVTIFTHVVDRSTDPATESNLQGEFYYDEETAKFTAANGRALFALSGQNPCEADQPDPDYCPLDQEVSP